MSLKAWLAHLRIDFLIWVQWVNSYRKIIRPDLVRVLNLFIHRDFSKILCIIYNIFRVLNNSIQIKRKINWDKTELHLYQKMNNFDHKIMVKTWWSFSFPKITEKLSKWNFFLQRTFILRKFDLINSYFKFYNLIYPRNGSLRRDIR